MFKISSISAVIFLIVSSYSSAQQFTLNSAGAADIPRPPVPGPAPLPVTPPGVTIANYTTDETFTFENQVKPAMDARIAALQAAGITTLGGRTVPAGNDYSFVIDYVPSVKGGAQLPPAVMVSNYQNGAPYWRTQDATDAMNTASANFKAARVPVLGAYAWQDGTDNFFAVDYLQPDMLPPAPQYDVKFVSYTGGKFTFESDAKKNVPAYITLLKQAGVPAIRGKAVPRQDGNYAVQVEYPVRVSKYGPRPRYTVARYDARETFPFENDALKAGAARLPAFTTAGAPALSAVSRKDGNDYSFSVDYLVTNIYQPGGAVPSVAVQTYQAQETFTFDTEAKKAMADRVAAFNSGGLPVVGSALTGSLGSFSYVLDYVAKAGQPGPGPGPQPR
jgi:hypothetical protein